MDKSKFQVGDIVTSNGGRIWHRCFNHSHKCPSSEFIDGIYDNALYRVLAVNAKIPVDAIDRTANTLIMNLDTEEIIAVNDCNLYKAEHKIVIDGKLIKISHESYLALKESLGC